MARKELLTAPAAAGKTAYALRLARATAVSHHSAYICVPTALQATAMRRRLAAAGGAFGVHVFTFDQLVAACLDAAGEVYTELSDPVRFRLLRTVIDRLPLSHYAPLKGKPGFVNTAGQLIRELKGAHLEPDAFATAVAALGAGPRLTELAAIYAAYQDLLHAERWADRTGLHWLAAAALAEQATTACRDWPLLVVDGFDDFTPAQLKLLALLADRVGHFVLLLPQAEAAAYPRYKRTLALASAALHTTPQPLPAAPETNETPAALRYLARRLFALNRGDNDDPLPAAGAVTLRQAPDYAAEARTALRWLKQRLVDDGLRPREVALLARDITPYHPFIRQVAAEFGLPVQLVDGQPLAQNPVIAALLSLLRLHLPLSTNGATTPQLPRRGVIAAWRSPYFRWPLLNGRATPITPATADMLDVLARQHRVIHGRDQWQAAFTAAARAAAQSNDDTRDDEEQSSSATLSLATVAALQASFDHFLASTRPPTRATMRTFIRWLENLIGPDPQLDDNPPPPNSLQITTQARAGAATAVADVAALRTLKDILRGLVWAAEAVSASQDSPTAATAVDFSIFFAELSGAIAAARCHLPAAGEQAILAANATQVRGLSFRAVALMGLSEGLFPATLSEDPFLRDADREALRQHSDFDLPASTRSAEQEFFYEAITRARQQLLLTRPVLADNGADWVASPYWEAVRQLVTVEPETIASETIVPLAETASAVEWWETRAALSAPPADLATAAIWRQITTAAHIWQLRDRAVSAVYEGDLSALAAALAARFGPDHVWSASRLEAYQTCGFLFYLQNVLALQPRPEPAAGLDAAQLGRLYHRIFEETAGHVDATAGEDAVRTAVAAIAQPILEAAPETEGFRVTPWWSQTRREIIDNVTQSLILLAAGPYTFDRAEAAFGIDDPPLVIEDDSGDTLRLRGFIDRVDRQPDGRIRLIDYKLASRAGYTARKFAEGDRLQLPLYALAAQEALRLGAVADGFFWHFRQAESSSFTLAKVGVDAAIATAVAHAWRAVHQIRQGAFAPRPPAAGCPAYCPAAAFCWQYTPRLF